MSTTTAILRTVDDDGAVTDEYEVKDVDGGSVVIHTQFSPYLPGAVRSQRQATPTLSRHAALSYALSACGWGPLHVTDEGGIFSWENR